MPSDLSTRYLGLRLRHPIVISACTLSQDIDNLRRLEAAGAAGVVLYSLFEEQIEHEDSEFVRVQEFGTDSFAEALTYFPSFDQFATAPEKYLRHIEAAKKAVSIPVIASLNGITRGGWVRYARLMESAGADALELNIYFVAADCDVDGREVEKRYIDLVAAVRESVGIPLAVKIGPQFSSPGHMARQLVQAGANGLVLFNRFLQPDIDLDLLEVRPHLEFSTPYESLLPLRWIAILRGRVRCSLALTSGVHSARELAKAILAGADVVMIASVLYQKGFDVIGQMISELMTWMDEHEYDSVEEMKGALSQQNCPDPTAFERGNYMKALVSYVGREI
ncbi:MAG: dihydroorotate dehydrogenase-like protein [Thermoguttaceae bacterium]|nr:dihydroorotate dehydrogenase-like protein [Thermoguttaceae bacterium]MDW8078489.1 dihydroorotate dehydrogenase-like protein [Thermoguttaceae bacterium]